MVLNKNDLVWAKVKPEAIIPSKRVEDAGYDIYPCFDEDYIVIPSHHTKLISTGIAAAVCDNYYIQVEERGSTGGRGIKKSAGVIDSGYRGEIFIGITNSNDWDLIISKLSKNELEETNHFYDLNKQIIYPYHKAIAQLIIHEVPKMNVRVTSYEELQKITSVRMTGVCGSTGK